jgi:hypothetical protein
MNKSPGEEVASYSDQVRRRLRRVLRGQAETGKSVEENLRHTSINDEDCSIKTVKE